MSKIRRVNIYAGPCCAKTTVAATIFAAMKVNHFNVEQVRECIKDWAYENRKPVGFDQYVIFASQLGEEQKKLKHVDYVVTDSPLLLNTAYAELYGSHEYQRIVETAKVFEEHYPSYNILLKRSVPYNPYGRYQNENEAVEFDHFLRQFLTRHMRGLVLNVVEDVKDLDSFLTWTLLPALRKEV